MAAAVGLQIRSCNDSSPSHWEKNIEKGIEESKVEWAKHWRKGGASAEKEKLEKSKAGALALFFGIGLIVTIIDIARL